MNTKQENINTKQENLNTKQENMNTKQENLNYKNKYLKYKNKYIQLKNKLGGDYAYNKHFNLIESLGFEFECKYLFKLLPTKINDKIYYENNIDNLVIFDDENNGNIVLSYDTVSILPKININPYLIININYRYMNVYNKIEPIHFPNYTLSSLPIYKIHNSSKQEKLRIYMNTWYNHTEFLYTIPNINSSLQSNLSVFYYYTLLFYKIIGEFFKDFTEYEIINDTLDLKKHIKILDYDENDDDDDDEVDEVYDITDYDDNDDEETKDIKDKKQYKLDVLQNWKFGNMHYKKINLYKSNIHDISFLAFEEKNNPTSILENIKNNYNTINDILQSKYTNKEIDIAYKQLIYDIPFAQQTTIGAKLSNIFIILTEILKNQYTNEYDIVDKLTLFKINKDMTYRFNKNIFIKKELPKETLQCLINLFSFIFYEFYKESNIILSSKNINNVDNITYIRYKSANGCDFILRHPYNDIMDNILFEWFGTNYNIPLINRLKSEIKKTLNNYVFNKLTFSRNINKEYIDIVSEIVMIKINTTKQNKTIININFTPNIDKLVDELFNKESTSFIFEEKTHLGSTIIPMPEKNDKTGKIYKTILLELRTFDDSVTNEIITKNKNLNNEIKFLEKTFNHSKII